MPTSPSTSTSRLPVPPTTGLAPPPVGEGAERPRASETALKIALAGASNMSAACVTNPADLVKVRQQLRSRIDVGGANFAAIVTQMVRTEGLLSLWKGLSASLLREGSYSALRFGTYDLCKREIRTLTGSKLGSDTFAMKLSAGMTSGMLSAGIANPADLLKVRLQSYGNTRSLRDHIREILDGPGIKGFYRALWPTMLRAGILTSSQLGTYDEAKSVLLRRQWFAEGPQVHLVASGIAGLACSLTSAPVDTIKVQMMRNQQFPSAWACLRHMIRTEGVLSPYRGLAMCWVRLWPHTVVSLSLFEWLRKLTGLRPI